MALPKHNGFIRLIYIVTILLMFGFIGWLVQTSLSSDQPYAAVDNLTSTEPAAKPSTIEVAQLREGAVIAGIESRINLSSDVQPQLERSWQRFAELNLQNSLKPQDPSRVFAVYHNYDPQQNRVSVTLGYPAPKNFSFNGRIHAVTVDPGQYMVLPQDYVLDSWSKAEQFNHPLRFKSDYEIYQLSADFQVDQFTAYVSIQ